MRSIWFVLIVLLSAVTGCTTAPVPAGPERLSQQVARSTLERAQQAYDAGNYQDAISTLRSGASVFEAAEPALRQAAMKLEAFSYCVSNQPAECQTQFGKLLRAYPSFKLSVAERKHPVWGPAFEAAQKAQR